MFFAEQDERELRDALRLHEREHFKKFIERAEATRHENKAETVFYETNFARKKIMEVHRHVGVFVAGLLERQFNVEANRFTTGVRRAFVGRFHNAGTATSDDGEIMFRQPLRDIHGGAIVFVGGFGAGGAEDGHGGTDLGHRLERIYELGHDAEDAPRIFVDEGSGFAHDVKVALSTE